MDINNARQQCHHAVQLNTRLGCGFIPASSISGNDDEGRTSLVWLTVPSKYEAGALAGQWVDSSFGKFRLALSPANLTFLLLDAEGDQQDTFPLDGRTFAEAQSWLAGHLTARGLDPVGLSAPLHFQLDDHPLAHGAPFLLAGAEPEFEEFARHYADAAELLEEIREAEPRASEVRCWPHHFDIATLIALSRGGEPARTIGVGLSPGDHTFDEPYYYVSPYPYPEPANLPALDSGGFWNTKGWTGAVLPAGSHSLDMIREFLAHAIRALEELQGNVSVGR